MRKASEYMFMGLRVQKDNTALINWNIDFTFDCNVKCGDCNKLLGILPWSDKNSYLTEEDIRVAAILLRRNFIKVNKISVSGGEPLMNSEIVRITKVIFEELKPSWYRVYTSGTMNKPKVEQQKVEVKTQEELQQEVEEKTQEELQQDLLKAIKANEGVDNIKQICEKLDTLDFGDSATNSPLFMVCAMDLHYNPDLIQLFVEMGADVNYRAKYRSTPIMFLAQFGALDMVKYLVSKGADYSLMNDYNIGLLEYAKESWSKEMIGYAISLVGTEEERQVILQKHLLKLIRPDSGYNIDEIRDVCKSLNTLDFGKDHYTSPLLMACSLDYFKADVVKLLVELGADVNYRSGHDTPPIMYIAQTRNLYMVVYLIGKGADPTFTNGNGFDLLFFARASGNSDMIKFAEVICKPKVEQPEEPKVEQPEEPKVEQPEEPKVEQPEEPVEPNNDPELEEDMRMILMASIKNRDDLDSIRAICQNMNTLNFGGCHQTSPLLMVCTEEMYNPELIEMLVELGADVNYKSRHQ